MDQGLSKNYIFPITKVFYWILFFGQLLAIVLLLNFFSVHAISISIEKQSGLVIVMLFLLMFGIVFSKIIYTRLLNKAKEMVKKEDRIKKVNRSIFLKHILLAAPSIIGIYFYSISGSITFVVFSSILFFLFFVERPSVKMMERDGMVF